LLIHHDQRSVAAPRQRTLQNGIGCVGTGLHTGARVSLTMRPAAPGSGIRFRRLDRPGSVTIPATFDRVSDTTMCTTLTGADGTRIATVEHLMAALAACEVDNVLIEVSGPEVPIMDGSAEPFVFLIECAGTVEQPAVRRAIEVLAPIAVEAHGKSVALEPAVGFELDCRIDFDHPLIRSQSLSYSFDPATFRREIARARTFGFAERVEELWSKGLALGGSLKNAVVVSRDRVLNEEGLRFPDEFVRHKLLDSVGDLYLAGAPIVGRFIGRCAGHATHHKLLCALFAEPSRWRYVGGEEATMPMALPEQRVAVGGN
jgi:UDP-3-O-[3-hydroxymyristoyl] N-acetylglucosamine deacetylase